MYPYSVQEEKELVLSRANGICEICNKLEAQGIHHVYYQKGPYWCQAICRYCHFLVHGWITGHERHHLKLQQIEEIAVARMKNHSSMEADRTCAGFRAASVAADRQGSLWQDDELLSAMAARERLGIPGHAISDDMYKRYCKEARRQAERLQRPPYDGRQMQFIVWRRALEVVFPELIP